MDFSQFQEIVEAIILPTGEELIGKHQLRWAKPDWKNNAYNLYESKRKEIRTDMCLDETLGDHRIDRHKIAAGLLYALMLAKPLEPTTITKKNAAARMANEQLAVLSALKLVLHFVEERLLVLPEELNKIDEQEIAWPKAQDIPYLLHLCKTAHHAIQKSKYSAYLVANVFFMIEAYHLNAYGCAPVPELPCTLEAAENNP